MASYLERIDQTPAGARWALVRGWMDSEPLALYAELRRYRPVLRFPELMMVTRFADCTAVLHQHDVFSVALYKPKQSDFWMSDDDTAKHWREKGIMQSILDLENLEDIRSFVAQTAAALLQAAPGELDVVDGLCRAVPIKLVQERFGFDQSDPRDLFEWSYWNQYDAFHNQPFDSVVVKNQNQVIAKRIEVSGRLRTYLGGLVQRRVADLQAGAKKTDPVTRLLKLSLTGALNFDPVRVAQNVGGLLIGAVETTSHAAVNALAGILGRPEVRAKAVAAAANATEVDGYVFESLRFDPAFPYFFRVCERPAVLAANTDYATNVAPGTTVLAVTHSAMFDPAAFPAPDTFDPSRPDTNNFHFGYGLHECLGRHIGRQMIPEIVRQILLLPGVQAASPPDNRGGPVPESYVLKWDSPARRTSAAAL
jgi:cytochrome P450